MTGFISRWSRLKRGEDQLPPAALPEAAPPELAAPAEEPEFDLSLLPSLEDLTAESDISRFLHKAVPQGLRQAALKRIWTLDPAIRDFVGPVDYAWDFNAPGGLPGITEAFTGDVTELLARAIGAVPPEQPPEAPAGDSSDAPLADAAVAAAAAPLKSPPEAALPSPQQGMLIEVVPAPAETMAILRRHGGAIPFSG